MVLANIMGTDGIIVLVILLVVVFGGSQLPKLARNVGSAGKEFRKAQEEAEQEEAAKSAQKPATPAVNAAPAPPPPVAAAPAEDKMTLSKTELNALLDEREARTKGEANN
ncbi:MAG: twin-arginine translocase TatA/TatE family subunit [Actinomycetota bacterium]|nr:twin-arginine translocase TatA/TatE family subunit [Actinomycetota bacterium]